MWFGQLGLLTHTRFTGVFFAKKSAAMRNAPV
ncbi:hypothetical protein LTSEJOH_1776, partial [Salmonella enterica subsp. enterica serovar Johannesburg str. S5-703]